MGVILLSEATVKTHIGRVLSKLELCDRAQVVVFAYEAGIVRSGSRGLTATVTATAANYGELQRTSADGRRALHVHGELWRTTANAGGLRATGLENH
jgi:Bacterial regulatory proteins, luxR family